jgi:mono/diheme cytochrome c family protein
MRFKSQLFDGALLGMVGVIGLIAAAQSVAHDDKPHTIKGESEHIHAPVPPGYVNVTAPLHIWTDPVVLHRGEAIHSTKCAVCHGTQGAGDGPDASWGGPKAGSFLDRAMVAQMTETYWFWRVSEGALVEPYKSKGSVMPAYKDDLSVEDRWAVIAYQHAQSGHAGPHVAAEHPEMQTGTQAHPESRGVRFDGQWVTRDHRWQPRGPWKWAVMRDLPLLYREFNGIDFGHAHLAETLLRTQKPDDVETSRREVLDFIFSSPAVPPDEEQVAPTFTRMAWEVAKAFDWAHIFHRSLYDLFASDKVKDKEPLYRKLLADYLEKPEAITPHRLDHHKALWSFPESKSFRDKFRTFNTQIWAYHWLQAAVYDVQLTGDVKKQQELMPKVIAFYHGYLRRPPEEWQYMPMMTEAAPEFAKRFPEAAAIFDNLHMLHDNFDDILARPDLYPTLQAKRAAILKILPIYLNRSHAVDDRYADFHEATGTHTEGHSGMSMSDMGPRPPAVHDVLTGNTPPSDQPQPAGRPAPAPGHKH